MINIQLFEEYGIPSMGRGTIIDLGDIDANPELGNFNLKMSPDPLVPYYPTQDSTGFALQRPLKDGEILWSFKKYLFFKVSGSYTSTLKDLRIQLMKAEGGDSQVDKFNLFYNFTNTYQQPNNAFDGKLICAGKEPNLMLHPMTSSTSPITATSRGIVFGPNSTIYTNYLVLQIGATKSTWNDVGNTTEFQLRLSFKEFM